MRWRADYPWRHAGRHIRADRQAHCGLRPRRGSHYPTCGDKITVELQLDGEGRVTAMAHDTKACVLTQASASILGHSLKGASREDVETLANDIATMLVTKGSPPAPPFEAYSAFEGAVEHRTRHRCVLLPVEAVLAALEASENS